MARLLSRIINTNIREVGATCVLHTCLYMHISKHFSTGYYWLWKRHIIAARSKIQRCWNTHLPPPITGSFVHLSVPNSPKPLELWCKFDTGCQLDHTCTFNCSSLCGTHNVWKGFAKHKPFKYKRTKKYTHTIVLEMQIAVVFNSAVIRDHPIVKT